MSATTEVIVRISASDVPEHMTTARIRVAMVVLGAAFDEIERRAYQGRFQHEEYRYQWMADAAYRRICQYHIEDIDVDVKLFEIDADTIISRRRARLSRERWLGLRNLWQPGD